MRLEVAAEFLKAVVNSRDATFRNELDRLVPGIGDFDIARRARLVVGPYGDETLELDGKPVLRFGQVTFSVRYDDKLCLFKCEAEQPFERLVP